MSARSASLLTAEVFDHGCSFCVAEPFNLFSARHCPAYTFDILALFLL